MAYATNLPMAMTDGGKHDPSNATTSGEKFSSGLTLLCYVTFNPNLRYDAEKPKAKVSF